MLQKKKAKEGRSGDEVEHYPVPSRVTVRRGSVVSVEEVKDSVGVSSSHVCHLYLFHLALYNIACWIFPLFNCVQVFSYSLYNFCCYSLELLHFLVVVAGEKKNKKS